MNTLALIVTDSAGGADQNWPAAAWVIYGGVAFILLLTGLIDFSGSWSGHSYDGKKAGARRALAAPVWPIVLVVVLVVGLVRFIIDLWKAAYIK